MWPFGSQIRFSQSVGSIFAFRRFIQNCSTQSPVEFFSLLHLHLVSVSTQFKMPKPSVMFKFCNNFIFLHRLTALVPKINCVKTKFPAIIVKTDVNKFMDKSSQGRKSEYTFVNQPIFWMKLHINYYLESSPALKFTTNLELSSRERLKDVWCNFTLTFLVSFESNFGCQVVIWYWDGIGEMEFRLGLREQGSSKYNVAVWYRIRI